jgi:cell wall-associated NlpC family hydrolase
VSATGGAAIARTALGLRGIPYRLGGSDLEGFDCSGLVQYVLAQHGVSVPRVVDDQVELGREIDDEEIRPGDLIFFAVDSRKPSHVGIAIGGEQFVHAPRTGQRVRVDALSSPYWRERYKEARRLDSLSSGGAMLTLGDEAP